MPRQDRQTERPEKATSTAPDKRWEALLALAVRNPSADASPSREPTGQYRIVTVER